jgi:hypothetical protein
MQGFSAFSDFICFASFLAAGLTADVFQCKPPKITAGFLPDKAAGSRRHVRFRSRKAHH